MREFQRLFDEYQSTKHPLIMKYCHSVIHRLKQEEERQLELLQKQVDLTKPTVV
jgi:hypothetical protein